MLAGSIPRSSSQSLRTMGPVPGLLVPQSMGKISPIFPSFIILPDDVPEEVKIRRLNEIIALQNRLSAEANARCVGKTYEVLVEGVSKRSRDQLFGRTEQNRVVVFDRGTHRVGDFVMVKVTESSSATLKGEEVAG